MPLHPTVVAILKSILLRMEAAFPKAIIQFLRYDTSITLVTYVVNGHDSHPLVHQIHITTQTKTPGPLCLQWYEEAIPRDRDKPLVRRINRGLPVMMDDPNGDKMVFRTSRHIMAARFEPPHALEGWIARTRHLIDVGTDCLAWAGLDFITEPEIVRHCWDQGSSGPDIYLQLDRTPDRLILRPGDPQSPVISV